MSLAVSFRRRVGVWSRLACERGRTVRLTAMTNDPVMTWFEGR